MTGYETVNAGETASRDTHLDHFLRRAQSFLLSYASLIDLVCSRTLLVFRHELGDRTMRHIRGPALGSGKNSPGVTCSRLVAQ